MFGLAGVIVGSGTLLDHSDVPRNAAEFVRKRPSMPSPPACRIA
jgi:hypothetical protein